MKKLCLVGMIIGGLLTVSTHTLAQTQLDPKLYDKNGFRIDQKMTPPNTDRKLPPKNTPQPTAPTRQNNTEAFKQGEPASCFDYYTFGSIGVNLTQDRSTYTPGDPLMLRGQITNNNRYPLTDLTIRARLVRNIPNPEYLRSEIITIEDFIIAENITLGANASFTVDYTHILPLNAPKGDYQVFFYAYNNDRFNQSGLSFTNDIVASRLSFDVTGNRPQHIYLDQTRITLNDKVHNVMAFVTNHEKNTPININIPLVNPSSQDESMNITYTLYKWDGLRKENIVDTKTETITVPANKEVQLTYTADNTDTSVYFLTITADNQTQKKDKSVYTIQTQSNIRFSVNGYDFPRVNSFGVDQYPIKADQETTLFTCYHNGAAQQTLGELNIKTQVLDTKGKVISETEYQGKIGGDISAIVNKFTTKKDLVNYKIVTTMTDSKGNIIDTIEDEYRCEDLDPTMCPTFKGNIRDATEDDDTCEESDPSLCPTGTDDQWPWIILGALLLLILIIIFMKRIKRNTNIPTAIFVLLLLIPVLTSVQKVEAAAVTAPFEITPNWPTVQLSNYAFGYCDTSLSVNSRNSCTTLNWSGSFSKIFNFVKDETNQSSNFTLNKGESVLVDNQPTTGYWFLTGDLYDSPPMDGVDYARTYINTSGVKEISVNSAKEIGPSFALSIPQEKGQTIITSSNPNIVSCTSTGCTASSAGTTTVTISFENIESLESPYGNKTLTYKIGSDAGAYIGDEGSTFLNYTLKNNPNQNIDGYPIILEVNNTSNNGFINRNNTGFGFVNIFYTYWQWYSDQWLEQKSHTFSFPSITYTITVPPAANTPQTTACAGATDITTNSAKIRWTYSDPDNDAQTNYQIQIATDASFGNIIQSIVAPTSTDVSAVRNHTVTGLSPNTTYYSRIRTYNATNSWSTYQTCTSFTTLNQPINGVCGSASGKTYASTVVSYSPDTQCTSYRTSSNTTFPAMGASVTWTCSGTYGGNPSTCVASRAPQATDYCNNIEDIQTTVPAGLIRTAGDCVCGV